MGKVSIGVSWINDPNAKNIYIGKSSALGNKHAFKGMSMNQRTIACDRYYNDFTHAMNTKKCHLYTTVCDIFSLLLEGNNVNLQCYCKSPTNPDLLCHGETIKEYLDIMIYKYKRNPHLIEKLLTPASIIL